MKTELTIMQDKLQGMLEKKSVSIEETIRKIQTDGELLNDFVLNFNQLDFKVNEEAKIAVYGFSAEAPTFSRHAIGQMSERLGVPSKYIHLLNNEGGEEWKRHLAVDILNTHSKNANNRILMREIDGRVRGVLSERYRRLNTQQLFTAYLMAASTSGAVLVDAYSNDDMDFIEVVSPELVKIELKNAPAMYQIFGARMKNSDFGKTAFQIQTFTMNMICSNGMVGDNMIREIHLGSRIPDGITASEDTVRKDTEALSSIITDTVAHIYKADNVALQIHRIQRADEVIIDIPTEIKQLPKLGVTSGELTELEAIMHNSRIDDGLSGEPTLLKLTQGLTALARDRKEENGERGRYLEDIASKLLTNKLN